MLARFLAALVIVVMLVPFVFLGPAAMRRSTWRR